MKGAGMTTEVDTIIERYVKLGLALDEHLPGYIDAYYGPSAWRDEARTANKRDLAVMAREVDELAAAIAGDSSMDAQRHDFLARQVRAMAACIDLLRRQPGEALPPLAEEAAALYDIAPEWTDESVFAEAHAALEELLPGNGTLAERMTLKKKEIEVSVEQAAALLQPILAELRRRTQARYPLPEGESFEIQFVSGQPWGAYNWYLGHLRSRIDICTDVPLLVTGLCDLLAHEGYPGHHTELSNKEVRLTRKQGWLEHAMVTLNGPSCVIAEGIAVKALEAVMTDEELAAWHAAEIFPRVGLVHLDAQRELAIARAMQQLRGVSCNAAFLYHDRQEGREATAAYVERWGLSTPLEAKRTVDFITTPPGRSYIFTYSYGSDLLDELFAKRGEQQRWFTRLLTEPVTPSQIRDWIAIADAGVSETEKANT
jgi:hypothetical protein